MATDRPETPTGTTLAPAAVDPTTGWRRWIDKRIARALARDRRTITQAVGRCLGENRAQYRLEVEALREQHRRDMESMRAECERSLTAMRADLLEQQLAAERQWRSELDRVRGGAPLRVVG